MKLFCADSNFFIVFLRVEKFVGDKCKKVRNKIINNGGWLPLFLFSTIFIVGLRSLHPCFFNVNYQTSNPSTHPFISFHFIANTFMRNWPRKRGSSCRKEIALIKELLTDSFFSLLPQENASMSFSFLLFFFTPFQISFFSPLKNEEGEKTRMPPSVDGVVRFHHSFIYKNGL